MQRRSQPTSQILPMQIHTRHKRFCQTRLHHTHRSIPPVTPILYLDEPPAATDGSSGIQRNVVPSNVSLPICEPSVPADGSCVCEALLQRLTIDHYFGRRRDPPVIFTLSR